MTAALLRRAARAKNPPLTAAMASRFLHQATVGPRQAEIDALVGTQPAAWMAAQEAIAIPQTAYAIDTARGPTGFTGLWPDGGYSIWGALSYRIGVHNDLLRNRITTALVEYFSVGISDAFGTRGSLTNFYTRLEQNAFGTFRALLEAVTRTIEMATWLTYWRNEKADGPSGRQPDENYAREIMQLYTIGLWELRQDGTRKPAGELDPSDPRYVAGSSADVPTYTQTDIANMARVFTGLSARDTSGVLWGFMFTNPSNSTTAAQFGWSTQLEYDNTRHETSLSKVALQGRVNVAAGTNGDPTLAAALDALVDHPSTPPFFATRMIRLLTDSNPSPEYVARVASVFIDDGTGQRGNLAAVWRAILLDQEARAPRENNRVAKAVDINGVSMALTRAFPPLIADQYGTGLPAASGDYPGSNTFSGPALCGSTDPFNNEARTYQLLRAPSVFGRWPSGYAPAGAVLNAGLVAPELFQYTENGSTYLFNGTNIHNFWPMTPLRNSMPAGDYADITSNVSAIVDRLSILLTADALPSSVKADLVTDITALPRTTDDQRRTAWTSLVWAIVCSPYFIVRT